MSLDLEKYKAAGNSNYKEPEKPAAPQSFASKVTNFFSSVGEAEVNLGKSVVTGAVDMFKNAGQVVSATGAALRLTGQTIQQDAQTQLTADQLRYASSLPLGEQRRAAFAKMGTPDKYIQEDDMKKVNDLYTRLGITESDSYGSTFRKSLGEGMNFAFAATTVLGGPAEAATNAVRATASTLRYVATDAVSGALVKSGLRAAGEAAGEKVASSAAKTMGESIIESAGPTARTKLLAATKNGLEVLNSTAAGRFVGKMINSGIVNGVTSVINEYSQGNDLSTPEERQKAIHNAGVSFLTGGLIEGVIGGAGFIKDRNASIKLRDTINQNLGTNYDEGTATVVMKNIGELQDTFKNVLTTARVQQLDEFNRSVIEQSRAASLDKANRAKVEKSNTRSRDALGAMVKNMPVHESDDAAAQHLTEHYGIDIQPTELADGIESKVSRKGDGFKLTFKKGNFADYFNQLGKLVPEILKKNNINVKYFDQELSLIPDSGLGIDSLDSREAKIQKIIAGLNSESAQTFRESYPTVASAFDAIYGVVKKITPTDAAKNFMRDNLPEHFQDLEHTIAKESVTVQPDPVTGSVKQVLDPLKEQRLWLDAQDLILKGKSKSEIIKQFKSVIDKSDEVSSLREAAQTGKSDNSLFPDAAKKAFAKADDAAASIKTLEGKVQFWKNHLKTFSISDPLDGKSRFDDVEPIVRESKLGGSPEVPETPTKDVTPEKLSTENVDNSVDKKGSEEKPQPAGVKAFITNKDRVDLGNLGYSVDEIRKMKPQEAADILSSPEGNAPKNESAVERDQKISRFERRQKFGLDNLTEEQKSELSTYSQINNKENIRKATEFVVDNPEEAMRILKGEIDPPEGILNNSIYLALENSAIENADTDLALKLASLRSTRAGQEISVLQEAYKDNPVRSLSEVRDARMEAAGGKEGLSGKTKKETSSLKKAVDQEAPTKNHWNSFIDSIAC